MTYYRSCRVRCKRCDTLLSKTFFSTELNSYRMMTCRCGAVSLDPHPTAYRIIGSDYEDTSEPWPEEQVDITGTPLTPSLGGKDCLGNGEHPGIECCCENCNHYLICYPDIEDDVDLDELDITPEELIPPDDEGE